ncbi:uncharacterized protein LOC135840561 [Planococcus citri]|uniref:uncharacterized protein LOC135840561 n=1 Tax=Planococcus citri TaxID=170843 RepID=UPI0031F9C831
MLKIIMDFLMSCILFSFLIQCSDENTVTTTPSPFDQEAVKLNEELEYIRKPNLTHHLFKKLCRERLEHKQELKTLHAKYEDELRKERTKYEDERRRAQFPENDIISLLYRNISMDAICGRKFLSSLEVFPLFYAGNSAVPPLSENARNIIKLLKRTINDRANELYSVAIALTSLYEEYAIINDTLAWNARVGTQYQTLKRVSLITISQQEREFLSTNITEHMLEFRSASSEPEAIELFKKQCRGRYWWNVEINLFGDNTEIGRLALLFPEEEKIKLTQEQPGWEKLDYREMEYVNTVFVKSMHMLTGTYRYEKCVQTFYFGNGLRLKYPLDQMKLKWPEHSPETRVRLFCDAYSTLHKLFSSFDIHVPLYMGVDCKMDSTYLENYLKRISAPKHRINAPEHNIEDFLFVGKLILP